MRRLVFLFVLLCGVHLAAQEAGSITVSVSGLKVTGDLLLTLFEGPDGFPGDHQKARDRKQVKITASTMKVVFEKLPPGIYAIAVLHDENGNAVLDTGAFGIPKEGIAVSNNITKFFRAPTFDEAKITHNGKPRDIFIKIVY